MKSGSFKNMSVF